MEQNNSTCQLNSSITTIIHSPFLTCKKWLVGALYTTYILSFVLYPNIVHATAYTIVDLGLIGSPSIGGSSATAVDYTRPNEINNSGAIVGDGYYPISLGGAGAYDTAWGYTHAFNYANGIMTDLGIPPALTGKAEYTASYGNGINDNNWVVGKAYSDLTDPSPTQAIISINGTTTGLGFFGGAGSQAYDINNSNQIIGIVNGSVSRGFIYDYNADTYSYLGTLGGNHSYAYRISETGQVVGQAETISNWHAFSYINGVMTDLSTLENLGNSKALGVNDDGMVVGRSDTLGGEHAFAWTPGTGMTDLGAMGGSWSFAYDVNNSAQIVGGSSYAGNTGFGAFIYENGIMTDLNTLLPADFPGVLNEARSINNSGQIVATGNLTGKAFTTTNLQSNLHGFLLTPVTQLNFIDQINVARNTLITSEVKTVGNIGTNASISITGGEYSINNSHFTSATGIINDSDTLQLRTTSSADYNDLISVTIDIGNNSHTWNITTVLDTTPDQFTFTDQTDVSLYSLVTSNEVTITGLESTSPISITGGEYSINGGGYISINGFVINGDNISLRTTSSANFSTTTDVVVTIGGISDTFNVTTTLDSDGDEVSNNNDNCPLIANSNQTNTDQDAYGDACDIDDDNDGLTDLIEATIGTNPLLTDTDNDDYTDGVDDFPTDATESVDTDGDGVGDNADAFPSNIAASVDTNGNGKPNNWNTGCDTTCQKSSGLTLDTTDSGGSGGGGSINPLILTMLPLFIVSIRRKGKWISPFS